MISIAIGGEKGGGGKTTLACHIAAGLACRGGRVLLIDSDPQGHSTLFWDFRKAPGLYDLLVRDADWGQVVMDVDQATFSIPGERVSEGRLSVLPSNVETRSIAGSISDVSLIGRRVTELERLYDVVLFDMSPTPNLLHGSIYVAADAVIYPTKAEIWSFDGLVGAWAHRDQAGQYRQTMFGLPPIKVMGIVPMMVEKNTVEHSRNLASLREKFGALVWPELAKRIIWSETTKYCRPVYSLAPNHEAALELWEVIDRVEEGIREQLSQKRHAS